MATANKRVVRNQFDRKALKKVRNPDAKCHVKQSFRDECDINNILSKYRKTGSISHLSRYGQTYGDVPAVDFHTAMSLTVACQQEFDALPASIREEFSNNVAIYLEKLQDPQFKERAIELGLAEAIDAEAPQQQIGNIEPQARTENSEGDAEGGDQAQSST